MPLKFVPVDWEGRPGVRADVVPDGWPAGVAESLAVMDNNEWVNKSAILNSTSGLDISELPVSAWEKMFGLSFAESVVASPALREFEK